MHVPMTSTPVRSATASEAHRWMIYGANGYTGRLIAEEAVRRGMRPVLSGRNRDRIAALAATLDCEYRIADLSDHRAMTAALADIHTVIHCAGPFVHTARAMLDACLSTGTHYMDITGEIPVLEDMFGRQREAEDAGIAVLPGAGFDVVPTDCLAVMLKERLPDATRLRMAFTGDIRQSPGTWKATLEALPRCGAVRKNGELVRVPHAWKTERLFFADGPHHAITIPWGDVSSAWRSTGIPDIEIYGGVTAAAAMTMRLVRGFVCTLMKSTLLMNVLQRLVSVAVRGPSAQHRQTGLYELRGDVWNDAGNQETMFMQTPEGYCFTVISALAILPAMLSGGISPGVWTPAQALGSGFVLTLPGVRLHAPVGELETA